MMIIMDISLKTKAIKDKIKKGYIEECFPLVEELIAELPLDEAVKERLSTDLFFFQNDFNTISKSEKQGIISDQDRIQKRKLVLNLIKLTNDLGKEAELLLAQLQTLNNPKKSRVEINLDLDFNKTTELEIKAFFDLITAAAKINPDELIIINKRQGSIIIEMELSEESIKKIKSLVRLGLVNGLSGIKVIDSKSEGLYESINFQIHLPFAELPRVKLNKADLYKANLKGANLSGANLSDANIIEANLIGSNLRKANLGEAYLSGADIKTANLNKANLNKANLINTNLANTNLRGAKLVKANMKAANLSMANLRGANLGGANLSGANLSGANLRASHLSGAHLKGANQSLVNLFRLLWTIIQFNNLIQTVIRLKLKDMNGFLDTANLRNADLHNADLRNADLRGVDLREANLRGANLKRANLSLANLKEADLRGVDLRNTKLKRANLKGANLKKVNFKRANLSNIDFSYADLSDANLEWVNLNEADLSEANLSGVSLSRAYLNKTLFHINQSTMLKKMNVDISGVIFIDDEGTKVNSWAEL